MIEESRDILLSELLIAVRSGDQHAFSRLWTQYLPLIERLVARFLPVFAGGGDEDDLRQEAALILYQAALAYRIEQEKVKFGLFAKICITNRFIDLLRAHERRAGHESVESQAELHARFADPEDDPAARLLDAEAVASIRAVIDANLSPYERRVLGHYVAGRSARSIAETLGTEEKSVSNAIYRIRRKLRALL